MRFVLTVTVCFDRPGRYDMFTQAIQSLLQHEPDILSKSQLAMVVSEVYAPGTATEHVIAAREAHIRTTFPGLEFIQKRDARDAGQARSLNMILQRLLSKDVALSLDSVVWIHWEESWLCTRPFLQESIRAFDRLPWLTQLQLTPDWRDMPPHRYSALGDGLTQVIPSEEAVKVSYNSMPYHEARDTYGLHTMWPLYSLRPSVNRLSHYAKLGTFDEQPELWPVAFEYEYAKRWLRAGCIKAIPQEPAAHRTLDHVSTYMVLPAKQSI